MSLVSTLEALRDAGGTPDQLIAIVRAHEASREKEDECRRAKDAARQAKRRAKMPEDWHVLRSIVFERDDFTCAYCGERTEDPHCDHIEPLSKGGSSELSNLTTACAKCNISKGARSPTDWRGL